MGSVFSIDGISGCSAGCMFLPSLASFTICRWSVVRNEWMMLSASILSRFTSFFFFAIALLFDPFENFTGECIEVAALNQRFIGWKERGTEQCFVLGSLFTAEPVSYTHLRAHETKAKL